MTNFWILFNKYFSRSILHPQYFLKSYEHQAIEVAKKHAKGILVDIGCGRQLYKTELLPLVDKYIGVDHPKASQKYQAGGEKPDFLADATNLPFKNNYCDSALMISVLEHLPDPLAGLKEANRILKKNGYLILITVQNYPVHDAPFDYFRYTRFGLKNLFEQANFKISTITPVGSFPILRGQLTNVFLLLSLKKLFTKSLFFKILGVILVIPIELLCLLTNLFAWSLSQLVKQDKDGTFALYNIVVAKKP